MLEMQLGPSFPSPEVGNGFGLGFLVRIAPGLNPQPGSEGDYSWAGYRYLFLGRSPGRVGGRSDDSDTRPAGILSDLYERHGLPGHYRLGGIFSKKRDRARC